MLSKEEMGVWGIFLMVTGIFEMTKTNLLKNAHIKYVSGSDDVHEKTEVASSSMLINAALSVVFIAVILSIGSMFSLWLNTGKELSDMLIWFIPGLIFMVFFSHLEAIQQSHLDFKGVFAGYFVRQFLFFCAILTHFIFKEPFTLKVVALYQSFSILAGTVVLYIYSRKYIHFKFHPTHAGIKRILGYGGYIFGSGLLANLCSSLDQTMTSKFMNSAAYAADYNAASRINGLVDIPSYAASEVIFPQASRAAANEGIEKVKYMYEKMVGVLLSFTLPAALVIIIFPEIFIRLIAGKEYLAAAPILQLYMITGILRPMQNQAANLLNSMGKTKLNFIINSISLVLYLIINYVCLSLFGFYGAAIGTLIISGIGAVAWYFIMRRQINLYLPNIYTYTVETYKTVFQKAGALRSR